MFRRLGLVVLLICLPAGVFCACKQENSGTEVPTVLSGTPVPPEETSILIDEAHFSNADFRRLLAALYDTDGDGALSLEERENVILLDCRFDTLKATGCETEDDTEALDGFVYFPNLRILIVRNELQVVVKNHPSIRGVVVKECTADTLYVENCPEFCQILCYDGAEVDSLYIFNAAEEVSLIYDVHTAYANYVEKHILSGKLSMKGYSGGLTGTEDFYGEVPVEWIRQENADTFLSAEPWKEYLLEKKISPYEIDFFEETGEKADTDGKKGWVVRVNDENAWDAAGSRFSFDTQTTPKKEQIDLCINGVSRIRWLQRLEDRTRLLIDCDIAVVLKDEAGEQEIGNLSEKSVWCDIMTDGTIRSSLEDPSIEEWKQQSVASEMIPVDAEHFSEGSFRGYIEQHIDIDGVAGLSDKERESVLILDFSDSIRFYGGTLDGLEYFTGLTALYLGKTGSLIVENHPSLEIISGNVAGLKALWKMNAGMEESFYDEIGLNRLWVKNCPSLKRINLDLSKIEDVIIENCEAIDR